jgi:hypothetical protein
MKAKIHWRPVEKDSDLTVCKAILTISNLGMMGIEEFHRYKSTHLMPASWQWVASKVPAMKNGQWVNQCDEST